MDVFRAWDPATTNIKIDCTGIEQGSHMTYPDGCSVNCGSTAIYRIEDEIMRHYPSMDIFRAWDRATTNIKIDFSGIENVRQCGCHKTNRP